MMSEETFKDLKDLMLSYMGNIQVEKDKKECIRLLNNLNIPIPLELKTTRDIFNKLVLKIWYDRILPTHISNFILSTFSVVYPMIPLSNRKKAILGVRICTSVYDSIIIHLNKYNILGYSVVGKSISKDFENLLESYMRKSPVEFINLK